MAISLIVARLRRFNLRRLVEKRAGVCWFVRIVPDKWQRSESTPSSVARNSFGAPAPAVRNAAIPTGREKLWKPQAMASWLAAKPPLAYPPEKARPLLRAMPGSQPRAPRNTVAQCSLRSIQPRRRCPGGASSHRCVSEVAPHSGTNALSSDVPGRS